MTNKNKNRILGVISTIVFHAIAAVILFVLCFRTPLPLPGEAGVEVNLGMYAEAATNLQDNKSVIQQNSNPTSQEKVDDNEKTEDLTSDDEDVPSIKEVTEKIKETEETENIKEVEEEKTVINQRAIFQVPKNDTRQSSEGDSDGQGKQGDKDGLKNLEQYKGNGGSGGGPAYDLGGRGAKSISSPSSDFSEEGKIVVDIWVDKEGVVRRTEIGRGTTIVNESMRNSALQAARNSIFNKDDKAVELQKGTITYTFIIRQ